MEQEQIVDAIRDWLDNNDWHYKYDPERHQIKMGVHLNGKLKHCDVVINIEDDCYIVFQYAPINGDTNNLGELVKYLTYANYGLKNGNFELDQNDGEIRYKIYVMCNGLETIPEQIIEKSIHCGCFMFDRYGDGIAALTFGFSDAETEIQKAESTDD